MAGDWIKMTHALPEKPEVLAISSKTGLNRFDVVGRLFILWRWFDNNTTDGNARSVTSVTLDECLFGYSNSVGFVSAVVAVGWLEESPEGVSVVKFDEHISESAKTRAQTAKRVAKSKSKSKGNGEGNGEGNAPGVTNGVTKTVPREEKRRSNTPPTPKEGEEGFDAFWSVYPNRKAKQDAVKAWAKLKPDEQLQALILEAIAQQSQGEDWVKEGGRFVPHASTWLNGARWLDEPPKPRMAFLNGVAL